MKEVDGAVLLDKLSRLNYADWGDDINARSDYIRKYCVSEKPYCVIGGAPVFCSIDTYKTRVFYATDTNDAQNFSRIVFYSEVQVNRDRNGLLMTRGMYQSLVWKDVSFQYRTAFTPKFLRVLLTSSGTSFVDAMLVTDVEQTPEGAAMWDTLLATMLQFGFDIYFGLSAKSDTKCVIKVDSLATISKHYIRDIVAPRNNAYAYRTAIILRKGERIEDCIMPGVIVMTNKEAEELNVYREPLFMTETEFYSWKYSLYPEKDDE